MRRLVVEWSINETTEDNSKLKKKHSTEIDRLELIRRIKSLEMLHILRFDPSEVAAIIRLEAKDDSLKVKELLKSLLNNIKIEYQLLE